jgi:hypothetical protein
MRVSLFSAMLGRPPVMVLLCALLSPAVWAQQTASGIAGTVRDASCAVLPGVTVEAASPVLIEKVRTVVTNGEGRFNIVDLRPGTYVVTFVITGFSTVKREGIELTAGFTATVNADLQVGALAETITVSGATPLVDVQNMRKQTVMSKDLLDTLPTSTKNLNNVATITPGFASSLAQDVVGGYTTQVGGGAYHGKSGSNVTFDGMGIQHSSGNMGYTTNTALTEEVTLSTSGISAESNADGPVANMRFPGRAATRSGATPRSLQRQQVPDEQPDRRTARQEASRPSMRSWVWDATFSVGGPIKQDKVWFFASFREWGSERREPASSGT